MDRNVISVNIGAARPIGSKSGTSGIDKQPVSGPVAVHAPGPKGVGGSGLSGDVIIDKKSHGGTTKPSTSTRVKTWTGGSRRSVDHWRPESSVRT